MNLYNIWSNYFVTSNGLIKISLCKYSNGKISNDLHINKARKTHVPYCDDEKLKEYIIRYSPIRRCDGLPLAG